ncbi:LysR family transcriptional regulator [Hirschia baltica]|uniref:Transcriptional regulator, LysR family n=1 Tax=Hirschia baltica (strain ATCC 49814 / DSM 5838 / IFAM 1418) TaxID=582402 RepID=C6XJC3_HIRBI|nr:LysR family transcriptional regulator [Hirschia baltica]ACT59218.1 transcriptional regulator, LysR family [Hirschia baltica ATCC 49814]
MNSEWLLDFLELTDAGSFSRAAQRRYITQSAFSRRIRSLEEWVGTSLVNRDTHTMKLTPSGESFTIVAEQVIRSLEAGRNEACAIERASIETVHFAATHALSLTFFPTWLRKLEKDEPASTTLKLTADHMLACEKLMQEGRSQFLLCHHHENSNLQLGQGFKSVKLGEDILLPVVSLKLKETVEPRNLPLLSFSPESGLGKILSCVLDDNIDTPSKQPVFTSHLASVLTSMARQGRGIAWTVLSIVADDLETGSLVRASDQQIPVEIRLWRAAARQSPAAERLWSKVLKSLQ